MLLLIPSAKQMKLRDSGQPVTLPQNAQTVVAQLSALNEAELATCYKIKPTAAKVEWERWQALAQGTALSYPALNLFDGLMYRHIDRSSQANWAYYCQHVKIATALYGMIACDTLIAPHRLDFMTKVQVNEQSLKQYWRAQYDASVAQSELIVSLLSSEFEEVFSKTVRNRLVKVVFMEQHGSQLKTHSTISKKARGQFMTAMAQQNVTALAEIKQLTVGDFVYREALSTERELVFVKTIVEE